MVALVRRPVPFAIVAEVVAATDVDAARPAHAYVAAAGGSLNNRSVYGAQCEADDDYRRVWDGCCKRGEDECDEERQHREDLVVQHCAATPKKRESGNLIGLDGEGMCERQKSEIACREACLEVDRKMGIFQVGYQAGHETSERGMLHDAIVSLRAFQSLCRPQCPPSRPRAARPPQCLAQHRCFCLYKTAKARTTLGQHKLLAFQLYDVEPPNCSAHEINLVRDEKTVAENISLEELYEKHIKPGELLYLMEPVKKAASENIATIKKENLTLKHRTFGIFPAGSIPGNAKDPRAGKGIGALRTTPFALSSPAAYFKLAIDRSYTYIDQGAPVEFSIAIKRTKLPKEERITGSHEKGDWPYLHEHFPHLRPDFIFKSMPEGSVWAVEPVSDGRHLHFVIVKPSKINREPQNLTARLFKVKESVTTHIKKGQQQGLPAVMRQRLYDSGLRTYSPLTAMPVKLVPPGEEVVEKSEYGEADNERLPLSRDRYMPAREPVMPKLRTDTLSPSGRLVKVKPANQARLEEEFERETKFKWRGRDWTASGGRHRSEFNSRGSTSAGSKFAARDKAARDFEIKGWENRSRYPVTASHRPVRDEGSQAGERTGSQTRRDSTTFPPRIGATCRKLPCYNTVDYTWEYGFESLISVLNDHNRSFKTFHFPSAPSAVTQPHGRVSMNAARQACRPKHQVLVLKCYPKVQKNNAEAKANSSELSYLLYYASTRRSKLQKVVDFLDKRTTKDVWRNNTGSVQVTLQIVQAIIEKCPRDLPLYAGAVLRILRTILNSSDVTMVEETVPAFESLCAHQDPAALAGDQDYIRQYEEIVQLYAQFASKEGAKAAKTPVSWPVAIRYRKAGLRALKAVASSESLGSETGRQLQAIIPVVLLNIFSESGAYIKRLEHRESAKGEHEKEQALRRRQSVSTARTDEDEGGDPVAASGTTEDADKLAEEEVGVIALQALRNIFQGVNRGLLRLATTAVLNFVGSHVSSSQQLGVEHGSWATTLMTTICGWTPVQDRYTILVGAVQALVGSPIVESDLERQLVLATVIDYLLASTINFIGLSVMDVLVGFISHTLLLLQLGGPGSSIKPHQQQTTSVLSEKDLGGRESSNTLSGVVMEVVKEPSQARFKLLETIQQCMADLATHVYYTDQISDMVGAILSRLKPSRFSSISSTVDAIENPIGAVDAVADSASLQEKTYVDRFFSFETARLTALESVKAIIKTANARRPDGSSASVSRGRVGVSVWEGTQWLLRDPSGKVRKAYVDALTTWLNLEKKKDDLKIVDNYRKKEKENDKGALARRAASNASQRERVPKPGRGKDTFLPLLHLAVYENALFYVDSEEDYLLLHLLLTTLVNRLGVNAVRSGLSMVIRLQEDIATIEDPGTKIRVGSLVHGYLWALSMALDFEVSSVGRALHNEITRRNNKGLWVKSIRVPPMPIDRIATPHPSPVSLAGTTVQLEALNPFDNRDALVEKIFEGYSSSLYSPPSSPPGSPGRSMSISSIVPAIHQPTNVQAAPQLPYKVREELLADWSRDMCLATNTKDSSSASMTGSRSGTQYTGNQKNNYLGVNIPNGNLESGNNSPVPSPRRAHSKPPSTAYGLVGRLGSPHGPRSPSRTPGSSSSQRSTVRVDDLKRALSGSGPNAPKTSYSFRAPSQRYRTSNDRDSSASDSLVSVHSLSDASFLTTDAPHPLHSNGDAAITSAPRSQTATHAHTAHEIAYADNGVPPVPPIPESLRDKSISPTIGATDTQDFAMRPKTAPNGGVVNKSRSVKSRGRSGDRRHRGSEVQGKKPDFRGFLDSIGVEGDEDGDGIDGVGEGGVGKVPY
ncbi:hypothetical protein CC86DRAFT_455854 [Ophiobolus disseminans]|uniref:Uncharacterized protein n=1 Tax=Ophiobolus disseminans TaxID=1469910 RepID=A0A6A6ZZM8_9PLEO|nr:hypothetical protein CC86DRAFT_455854 [Ophiobolus disseminans]